MWAQYSENLYSRLIANSLEVCINYIRNYFENLCWKNILAHIMFQILRRHGYCNQYLEHSAVSMNLTNKVIFLMSGGNVIISCVVIMACLVKVYNTHKGKGYRPFMSCFPMLDQKLIFINVAMGSSVNVLCNRLHILNDGIDCLIMSNNMSTGLSALLRT